MKEKTTIRIGFLVFDGIQALDLFGPQEAFAEANKCGADLHMNYECLLISEDGQPVTTESGISLGAHISIDDCPPLHTLIIPGGAGSRPHLIPQRVIDWTQHHAEHTQRIGSVCTGLFILARTGLLNGRRVTTHWHNADEIAARFPELDVDADSIFIRDGKVITAAGITSGIDMALALIEEDMGAKIATAVARELVVFVRRPGGQNQYSTLLQQQQASGTRFNDLLTWIANNLTEDLSTEAMAKRVCLSERHFRRAFKQAHNDSPARVVERIRIDIAKDWLATSDQSIEQIARLVGYRTPDAFRHSFERQLGTTPSEHRRRFGGRSSPLAHQGPQS